MSTRNELLILNSALTQLMRQIRVVDDGQGVGRARLSALAVLHFGGECSLSELAQRELVSRATMHHVVKGLEGDRLVRRTPHPTDGRREIIALTARGRKTIQKAHQARLDYLARLAKGVDPEDLRSTVRTLDLLRNRANQALSG